jgi:hypothetical protein
MLPGTELAFENEVEYDPVLGYFLPNRKVGQKVARFRKVNNEQPHLHHDALEFPDGQIVLLTRLAKASTRPCCSCPPSHTPEARPRKASRALSSPDCVACDQAIRAFNRSQAKKIGLFHVTC